MVLVLVVAAALVPGAHADDSDSGGDMPPPAAGAVGDEGAQTGASAAPVEDQALAAAQDPPGAAEGVSVSADRIARTADAAGTLTGNPQTGGGGQEPQDPASLSVAKHRQEGQLPADRQPEAGSDDLLGEAEQLTQQLDAGQGCRAGGGCPEGPGIPGGPIVADTSGGTGRTGPDGDRPPRRQPLDLSRLTPEDREAYEQERAAIIRQSEARRETRHAAVEQQAAARHDAVEQRELANLLRQLDELDRSWARHAAGEAPRGSFKQQLLERVALVRPHWEAAAGSPEPLDPDRLAQELGMSPGEATSALEYLDTRARALGAGAEAMLRARVDADEGRSPAANAVTRELALRLGIRPSDWSRLRSVVGDLYDEVARRDQHQMSMAEASELLVTPGFTATDPDPAVPGLTATELDSTPPGLTATELDSTTPGFAAIQPSNPSPPPSQATSPEEATGGWSSRLETAAEAAAEIPDPVKAGALAAIVILLLSRTPWGLAFLSSPRGLNALPWAAPVGTPG